jgi:tyrosyl-tRNA synthetase
MYGKVMSMGDAQVRTYFELCTRVPMHEVEEILKGHPKEAKQRLAKEIVTIYHSKEAAEKADKDWVNTFSEGGVPEDILETSVGPGVKYSDAISGSFQLSKSEVRRLVEGGAVSEVGGEVISDINSLVTKNVTLRIGKHRFLKITVKN